MTKADMVNRMAKDAKVTKRAAEAALDSALKGIKDSLKKG
ncbi:MAG: HU family DNA-binding protein, partial [Candidatus Methylomirabilales bacterium]